MIVLDTNVISEMMRSKPDAAVFDWINTQRRDQLCTTSANLAEILCGLRALPSGRRRAGLEHAAHIMFAEDLEGRILPFDADAAGHYGDLVVRRREIGKPIQVFDALIASIASAAGACIVTRDAGGFEDCGLTIIDPWSAA